MIGHFNELLRATADDGASATTCLSANHSAEEIDQLLEAWFRERQERIETGLLLDEAQHLLKRIIREGQVTPVSRRKTTNLLLAIKAANQAS
ncbi:hypothetical protein SAMN05444166_6925 [Singulisphaera sp. GP187]|uniref:hypothetical protein n=1 Tax=Singulisphaera sp. GP187 TaxID=1882752 RepID=UPI000927E7ED|nr:hypothetical protein [Singulisphaera sp. GP187]SIO62025.1 hypothetical protein SAMN05444166_6925 [Singulisphaera sp. GP187]